jgi:ATP-binding cassette subfamily C protein CydC
VLTPLAAFEVTTPLPGAARHLIRGLRAAERLRDLERLPAPSVAWGNKASAGGTLALHSVDARWPGAAEAALHHIDFQLPPGRRVAVIGESGAGKSTLAAVLLGFLTPEQGHVTFGGAELSELDEAGFRRQVVLCAQGDHLFDTTIRNNLLIGRPDAGEQDLLDVLDRVRLRDWVQRQPLGLDTTVGERAGRLSGGERQRLALARALLADPAVLVLDEPTAHLDAATADELTRDILAATHGRTILLITHRLAGLEAVDEILELSAGHIVARGHALSARQTSSPAVHAPR